MKHLPIFSLSCMFALVFLFGGDVSAQAKVEKVWKLKQTSEFYGSQTMMWNDRSFRLDFETSNLVAVASAPRWEVSIYNTQTHRCYEDTFERFRKRYANCGGQNVIRRYVPGNKPPCKVGEFLAKQYTVLISHPGPTRFVGGTEQTEMWTCPLPMPLQVRESLAMLTHIPSTVGVPITIYGDPRDNNRCCLRTEYVKQMNADASCFAVPHGLQKMDNELALFLDQDENSGAVFSDISYLESKGSHVKKDATLALSGTPKH